MKHTIRTSAAGIALLVLIACGGEQTVASKSAAAFQEAQKKGAPMGGDGHGGHGAASGVEASGEHATMTGMDHSTMTGMDHSQMKPGQSMAGMDHSQMKPGQSMAGMDHSQMKPGQSMAGMDHSQMKPGQSMAGMDHSSIPGMQQSSSAPAVKPPTTTAEVQRLRPSSTLKGDEFDAPAAAAVSEARKASQGGGHEAMEMRGITPGQDHENPPTPAPAFRDGPTQGIPTPAMDHSSHRAAAPAVDHSQHGQRAPSAASRTQTKKTTKAPATPAAATVYSCPMHPEVTSDKPGTCPKCGMALVKKK